MSDSRVGKVTKILTSHIEPNPHNPRRLFDEEPMAILQESIKKLGILVPITVYPSVDDKVNSLKDHFTVLDGERRWRCALQLRLTKIPAIIIERPSDTENILVMFHIHNLREGWQLMPTALKLEVLMKNLGARTEQKLSVLTKLSVGQIRRCKILLSYPKRFQQLMLAPPTKRLKSDFFIELERIRGPALREQFPPWISRTDSKCIEIILRKYLSKNIKAVTDFRRLAEIYRGSVRLGKRQQFYAALDEFLENESAGIDSIVVHGAGFEKETREASRSANRLITQLRRLNKDALASNEDLVSSLRRLIKILNDKFEEAMVAARYRDNQ
jgi:ParB/RepB/Spo0J family partition protein